MKKLKKILRAMTAVILTALLGLTAVVPISLSCLRGAFTNEYILEVVESVDFAKITVPDGMGGFVTMADYMNSFASGMGIRFTDEDFNAAVRDFSLDSIIASLLQDCRAWIFDNAPRPSFDPEEMAEIVLAGLDETMSSFLSMMFGDRTEDVLVYIISCFTESSKIESRLDSLEFLREIFSTDALAFSISVCAMIIVLIFLSCRRKILPLLTCSAIAAAVSGAIMTGADLIFTATAKNKLLLALSFPESTFDIIYRPAVSVIADAGKVIVCAGTAVAGLLMLSIIIVSAVRNHLKRQ